MPNNTSHSEINLEELAERISEGHRAIEQLYEEASCNALHIALDTGQALIQAQSGVPTGEWERWLKGKCPRRSAYLYMQLARHEAEIEAKLEENPNLSLRAARRLIAKPKPKISAAGDAEPLAEDDTSVPTRGWLDPATLAKASDREVAAALAALGFERLLQCLPKGWDKQIQKRTDRQEAARLRRTDPNGYLSVVADNAEKQPTQH